MDTIVTTKGSTLNLSVAFGVDLTDVEVSIVDTNREVLAAAAIEIVDLQGGGVSVTLTDEQADELKPRKTNYFRLCLTYADGSEERSNKIWIDVQ